MKRRTKAPNERMSVSFPLPLTPFAAQYLEKAADEVGSGEAISVGHILLALLRDERDVTSQTLSRLGLREKVIDAVEEMLRNPGRATNLVVNPRGTPIGRMYRGSDGKPYVGDEQGNPISLRKEQIFPEEQSE